MRSICKRYAPAFLALGLLLVLAGCSDIFSPPAEKGGNLTVTINGGGGAPKTLMPEAPVFTKFVLSFTETTAAAVHVDETITPLGTGGSATLMLPAGTWDITVRGYANIRGDEYVVAEGATASPLAIAENDTSSVSITVSPTISGEPGVFSYDITLPSGQYWSKAELALYSGDALTDYLAGSFYPGDYPLVGAGGDEPNPEYRVIDLKDGDGHADSIELEPGYWLMILDVMVNNYDRLGLAEVAQIWSNMETVYEAVFTGDDFAYFDEGPEATVIRAVGIIAADGSSKWSEYHMVNDVIKAAMLDADYSDFFDDPDFLDALAEFEDKIIAKMADEGIANGGGDFENSWIPKAELAAHWPQDITDADGNSNVYYIASQLATPGEIQVNLPNTDDWSVTGDDGADGETLNEMTVTYTIGTGPDAIEVDFTVKLYPVALIEITFAADAVGAVNFTDGTDAGRDIEDTWADLPANDWPRRMISSVDDRAIVDPTITILNGVDAANQFPAADYESRSLKVVVEYYDGAEWVVEPAASTTGSYPNLAYKYDLASDIYRVTVSDYILDGLAALDNESSWAAFKQVSDDIAEAEGTGTTPDFSCAAEKATLEAKMTAKFTAQGIKDWDTSTAHLFLSEAHGQQSVSGTEVELYYLMRIGAGPTNVITSEYPVLEQGGWVIGDKDVDGLNPVVTTMAHAIGSQTLAAAVELEFDVKLIPVAELVVRFDAGAEGEITITQGVNTWVIDEGDIAASEHDEILVPVGVGTVTIEGTGGAVTIEVDKASLSRPSGSSSIVYAGDGTPLTPVGDDYDIESQVYIVTVGN